MNNINVLGNQICNDGANDFKLQILKETQMLADPDLIMNKNDNLIGRKRTFKN